MHQTQQLTRNKKYVMLFLSLNPLSLSPPSCISSNRNPLQAPSHDSQSYMRSSPSKTPPASIPLPNLLSSSATPQTSQPLSNMTLKKVHTKNPSGSSSACLCTTSYLAPLQGEPQTLHPQIHFLSGLSNGASAPLLHKSVSLLKGYSFRAPIIRDIAIQRHCRRHLLELVCSS